MYEGGLHFFLLFFFFVFFHPDCCRPRSEPMSFFQGIKLVMGHGPYAKLVTVFLFTSLAFMVRFGKPAIFLYLQALNLT